MGNQIIRPFPTPLLVADELITEEHNKALIKRCFAIRKELSTKRVNSSTGWPCDIFSTINSYDLTEDPAFGEFLQIVGEHVLAFAKHLGVQDPKEGHTIAKTEHAWFNISGKGQYQDQHVHNNSDFSVVYYMRSPKGTKGTIFKNPHLSIMLLPRLSPGLEYAEDFTTEATERQLVVFPSNAPHLTDQHKIREERISVSANYRIF